MWYKASELQVVSALLPRRGNGRTNQWTTANNRLLCLYNCATEKECIPHKKTVQQSPWKNDTPSKEKHFVPTGFKALKSNQSKDRGMAQAEGQVTAEITDVLAMLNGSRRKGRRIKKSFIVIYQRKYRTDNVIMPSMFSQMVTCHHSCDLSLATC